MRARCTHRSSDGTKDTLRVDTKTNEVECSICKAKFTLVDPNEASDTLHNKVKAVIDLIQTIKVLAADMDFDSEKGAKYLKLFDSLSVIEDMEDMYKETANAFNVKEYKKQGAINMLESFKAMFPNEIFPNNEKGKMTSEEFTKMFMTNPVMMSNMAKPSEE